MKRCLISRYDVSIKYYPFETVKIDEVKVERPENDYLGEKFAENLRSACKEKGYSFRFYTTSSDKNYDFEIVVY